jgi:hypothetical protein
MSVSVLPKVLSQIEGRNKLSAMHRLLCCIPDLCNVSDRVSKPKGNKRQKIMADIDDFDPAAQSQDDLGF